MQHIPPEWLEQLDALTAAAEGEPDAAHDERLLAQLAQADPDLLAFLVEQLAAHATPQAANALELLAARAETPEAVRTAARAAVDELASKGVIAPPPGEERYYAGWVQQGRERGEQILILGWRVPDGSLEALVFLLDWHGDGLKDFYRTRHVTEAEWRELLEHNGRKGAPLVEVSLAEGRTLIDAALAETRRFSRPLPREYRRESGIIGRRILEAAEPLQEMRSLIAPDLAPEEVVSAYVAALHYRDYTLMAELLTSEHPLRAGRAIPETVAALHTELKHAPRRRVEVSTDRAPMPEQDGAAEGGEEADTALVDAEGDEVRIEPSGRRVTSPVRERYMLRRAPAGWRIAAVTTTTQSQA